uniref:Putative secreted protein n=1 Tax=Ixodes ricinus TaxID=34613 RepID=A0A6B0U4W1_IXORI
MKKAPSISLAVFILLFAQFVKSLTEGMQPHLLQCTTRWPEGRNGEKGNAPSHSHTSLSVHGTIYYKGEGSDTNTCGT